MYSLIHNHDLEVYKMENRKYRWSNKQLRNHVEVLDEIKNPHIILKNATYLNSYLHEWDSGEYLDL